MSQQDSHWSSQKERGSYWGMTFMVWLYRLGGNILFSIVLYPVMTYFFLFAKNARYASKEFLIRAYEVGSPEFSKKPGNWHSYYHMLRFGQIILDKIAVWIGSLSHTQVDFPNREFLRAKIKEGKGGVLLVSHVGNLEICRAISYQTPSLKLNILVHTHHAEKFNALLNKVNPDSELTFLQVTEIGPDTAVMLKQKVEAGEFLAIVGDRIPVSSTLRTSVVPFMGKPARFAQGPFILAALMKCPVFTLFCIKDSGRYRVEVEPFADVMKLNRKRRNEDLLSYIEQYAKRLEIYATKYPYQWFNFYPYWENA